MSDPYLSTQRLDSVNSLLSQAWRIITQKLVFFLIAGFILAILALPNIYTKQIKVDQQDSNVSTTITNTWAVGSENANYQYNSENSQHTLTYPAWLTALTPNADHQIAAWVKNNSIPSASEWSTVGLLAAIILAALVCYGVIRAIIELILLDQIGNLRDTDQWISSIDGGRIIRFIWTILLQTLLTSIGFILLIIPGIIFAIWFSQTSYIFVSENLSGMAALRRSREYVKGYWWQVLGRTILGSIIIAIITAIVVGIITATAVPGTLFNQQLVIIIAAIAAGLAGSLSAIYEKAYFFSLYNNLKHLKSASSEQE